MGKFDLIFESIVLVAIGFFFNMGLNTGVAAIIYPAAFLFSLVGLAMLFSVWELWVKYYKKS